MLSFLFALTGLVATGTLNIDNVATPVSYSYDIDTDNDNGRTLQGFSTDANMRMRPGDDTSAQYFADFQKFVDYYGSYNYGDTIINAALQGTDANLANGDVLIQQAGIGMDGRAGKFSSNKSLSCFLCRRPHRISRQPRVHRNCQEGYCLPQRGHVRHPRTRRRHL